MSTKRQKEKNTFKNKTIQQAVIIWQDRLSLKNSRGLVGTPKTKEKSIFLRIS